MIRHLQALIVASMALSAPATAQEQAATTACTPSPMQIEANFDFIMGITPADSPLDLWCRLQTLEGEFKFNVMFGDNIASKTFDVKFDGNVTRTKEEFAYLLQSLIPTEAVSPLADPTQPFGRVLEKSVQLRAPQAPDGQRLAIHPGHPSANALVLWETMTIRLRPVHYGGAEFVLSVKFAPTPGRLFASVGGAAERLVLNGWWEDVLRGMGASRANCPAHIPECSKLPEVIPLETAWTLDSIVMSATTGQLSIPAHGILSSLVESSDPKFIRRNTLNAWSYTKGEGEVRVSDGKREVHARAEPKPDDIGGTGRIAIRWKEVDRSKTTYATRLHEYANEFRESVFLQLDGTQQSAATTGQ